MFLLWHRQLPHCGDQTLLQFPHWLRAGSALLTLLFFPLVPLSYRVLPWFCIFFSSGQVLLAALNWCSACPSVSEGIFLVYPWRDTYSMSSYSSAILFSPQAITFQHRASSLKWNTKHPCLWTSSGHWWHIAFPQIVSFLFFFFFNMTEEPGGLKSMGLQSQTWLSDFIDWLMYLFMWLFQAFIEACELLLVACGI